MDKNLFKNPFDLYRGKPFWAWNGKLNKKELIKQIHYMKNMGFSGFFMHSRTGLKTEYLGNEWIECIKECSKEAKKLGMQAWLYDEDRWPSGTAGGMVTKNPEFRQKFISMHRLRKEEFDLINYGQEYINSFAIKLTDNDKIIDYYEVTDKYQVKEDYQVLIFIKEEQQKQDFYNGYTYVDTLNIDAVNEFLNITLDKYKEKCGDLLGNEITGIFTDEPHRGCIFGGFAIQNKNAKNMVPYTYTLFEYFQKKTGYDLKCRLPEIYYFKQNENWSKTSYDYIEILQQMFINSFAKPYQEWCKKNNIIFTGHILHEDTLSSQVAVSGSVQRFYEYMDYPGIDVLTENNYNFWVAKQVTSVSKQLNKSFILSELYGCTGWQLNFEGHKHIGDWQAVLGVNLRCHHLCWYTMEGEAKRDFPGSIFYQSVWYDNYKYIEDYFARMGYILSQGESVTDTLVVNPVESIWGKVRLGCFNGLFSADNDITEIENNYFNLFKELASNGIDFDYCDEDILSRRYSLNKNYLVVGKMKYKTVVVSDLVTIRKSTLNILKDFTEKGGKVIVKNAPQYIDGVKLRFDYNIFENAENHSAIAIFCKQNSSIKISGIDDILTNIRKVNNDYFLVFVNTDREKGKQNIDLKINLPLNAEEWDLKTGEIKSCQFKKTLNSVIINTDFEKGGERCFRLTCENVKTIIEKNDFIKIDMPNTLNYKLLEDNVLVLDIAKYYVNGKKKGINEILKIDRALRKEFNMHYRGGEMIQPWYKKKYFKDNTNKKVCNLKLKYNFDIDYIPQKINFAIETPEKFKIFVNGKELLQNIIDNFIDNSIKRIEIPVNMLNKGANEISLYCDYNDKLDLEVCYLTGDFGVKLDGTQKTITKLPEKLDQRPLYEQYLPFYTGKIEFFVKLHKGKYKIKFDNIKGACYEVISEENKEIIAFSPYMSKILEVENEIKFVLNCTRRNLFGPLHLVSLYPSDYNPLTFLTEGDNFQINYGLIEEGLTIPKIFKRKEL